MRGFKKTEIGIIPEDWEVKRLGEIGEITGAGVDKKINKNEELQKEIEYLEAKIVILKFEKERANLKDGKPCPLCGALSHPYKNKFKDENIKEILKQLEEKQKELKENEKFIHKYNGIFENLKNPIITADSKIPLKSAATG